MCSYTSGYFLIYDGEYGCINYDVDDDNHVSHGTRGSANLRPSGNGQLAQLWWVKGARIAWKFHARTCGLCVGKYYTFNFVPTLGHPYDGLNHRSLIMSYMNLHSLTPIVGSLNWVFVKIFDRCVTSIIDKDKTLLYGWQWHHK